MRSSSSLLFFLFLLPLRFVSSFMASAAPPLFGLPGHANQCDALLQFGNSLTINTKIKSRLLCDENGLNFSSQPRTLSWKNGTDCCKWDGITCDGRNVVGVELQCSYLQGTLHSNSTLFSLRYIEILDLGGNSLSGQIPTSICQKNSLRGLHLTDNKVSGTIPPCLGNLSKLVGLHLSYNQIQGQLPKSLANCTLLEDFAVTANEITDTFPLWLKSLPLIRLQLGENNFHGSIEPNPTSFPFPYLNALILGANNLSGRLPPDYFLGLNLSLIDLIGNSFDGNMPIPPPTAIYYIISSNRFTGHIPSLICNATKLLVVELSNNSLTGNIPQCLLNVLSDLEILYLAVNEFQGTIPEIYAPNNCSLEGLDLSQNHLIGALPRSLAGCKSLEVLNLSGNEFQGTIPEIHATNNCSLKSLDLSQNHLVGALPRSLARCKSLGALHLSGNEFQGTIPEIYAPNNCSLKEIFLSQNHLIGTLPESFARCKSLEILDVSGNEIEDSFPSWLETLPTLYVLILRSNKFHGPISTPLMIHPFPKLHVFDISRNSFSGAFPTQYIINFREMATGDKGRRVLQYASRYMYNDYSTRVILKGAERQLSNIQWSFMSIDISYNNFQGEIPEDIGNLRSLMGLNFSHNKFKGAIPSSLRNLTYLESLDLSSNDLTGQIPRALADLTFLEILNLSNNELTGPIPQGRQFNTFNSDSFSGNPGLCGPPLSRACGIQPTPSLTLTFQEDAGPGNWIEWKAVPMGYACGLPLGISAGYMALQMGRPLWLIRMMEDKIYSLQTRARRTGGRSRG